MLRPVRRAAAACVRRAASTDARANAPLKSALLVTRAPVLQREPSAFEREYYRFNTALSHKLQQPFPRDMYFKKGSAAESRFDEYYTQLQKTWEVKTETRDPSKSVRKDAQSDSDAELYATMPRTTEADAQKNVKSIERALDRTLYLFVADKGSKGSWRLPSKELAADRTAHDTLHTTAMSAVTDMLGDTMDLWLVSKLPIAVVQGAPKTYVLRARVLAGEPLDSKKTEFAWLTKEEAAEHLKKDTSPEGQAYWNKVQDLLDE
ncbi:hypothetical protein MOBT1_001667 [Malassezia obtusa]|uniref:Large ribosomal subunit protein mL46 n=1 Tax=Malassezia obtusa TaxID=76774 RepID=A0AAF0DYN6_9BASI|nr:hypothetical protein MOBT1_001667 [Malassezia obtusa]